MCSLSQKGYTLFPSLPAPSPTPHDWPILAQNPEPTFFFVLFCFLHPGPALSRDRSLWTPPILSSPPSSLVAPHLIVEGAIGSTLCCSHSALIPHANSHVGVNIDSHQFLGLKHCDPYLGKE